MKQEKLEAHVHSQSQDDTASDKDLVGQQAHLMPCHRRVETAEEGQAGKMVQGAVLYKKAAP